MKFAIVLLLFAPLFAEDTFEVREVPADKLAKLHDAQAKVEIATIALKKAKEAVDAAQTAEKAATDDITKDYGVFKTECYLLHGADNGLYGYIRRTREAEIKGKYALITDKQESCNYNNGLYFVQDTLTVAK